MYEISILEKVGLSKNEASIYFTLLQQGPLNIKELAAKSHQSRPNVYKILPHLQELGLVTEVVKGKRKVFQGESPEHLRNIFEKTQSAFEGVFLQLQNLYDTKNTKAVLTSVEGKNFSKFVFDDVVYSLGKGETYLRYSARTTKQGVEKYDNYRKVRDEKEIQRLIITSEDSVKSKPSRLDHDVCNIPGNYDLFDDNISKVIYKDKVAIIDYNSHTSFIIEDPKFARFEAKIFKLLFRFLRKKK